MTPVPNVPSFGPHPIRIADAPAFDRHALQIGQRDGRAYEPSLCPPGEISSRLRCNSGVAYDGSRSRLRNVSPNASTMFLNYFALLLILIVIVIIFYAFIYIHELPYEAAKHRNHPQKDAIYVACWLSLFTLHAIWPLVFIWALSHKESAEDESLGEAPHGANLAERLTQLESRLRRMEERQIEPRNESSVA